MKLVTERLTHLTAAHCNFCRKLALFGDESFKLIDKM